VDPLNIQDRGDVVLVTFVQSRILDEASIREVGKAFEGLTLQAAADRKLLLSFRGVEFMSSAMIGKVVQLHKKCKADNIKLKLCDITPQVLEVFTITRLDKLLDIQKDEATALAAFAGAAPKRGWFG